MVVTDQDISHMREDRMQARTGLGAVVVVTLLLACLPSSAAALTFVQAAGSPYPTTSPPFVPDSGQFLGGAVSGDFNGDGIYDLAVVDATGLPIFSAGESVSVLLGTRSGGFTMAPGSPVDIYSGGMFSATGAIAAGDFTGNGKLDLAVVDEVDHTISILLGDGKGHFQPTGTPIPFPGGGTASIAVGDFNGDGKQDIAVVNSELTILLGNGSGGFTPAPGSPLPQSGFPTSIVAGDFNGEGRSDLAVANRSGYVTVYLSSTTGSMHASPESPIATGADPQAIATANLTSDGKLDLVTANASSNDVTVLLGNGSGGFVPASGSPFPVLAGPSCVPGSEPGLPESIAVGNFAGDGTPDLAVANFNGCSDSVAVLQGDGKGQFTNAADSPFAANGNPRGMATGDFNGDGKPDIAVVNAFLGAVTVLLNTTSAPLESSTGPVGPTAPTQEGTIPQPPSHHRNVTHGHRGAKLKAARCSRLVKSIRRGHRSKIYIKKCPVHRISTTHKSNSSASRRRLSSRRPHDGLR
jgi:FG-GAP-like repeat